MSQMFNPDHARITEASRRLKMLGPLAEEPKFDYKKFRERAGETGIPTEILNAWHTAFHANGETGLQPTHWEPLNEKQQGAALPRYHFIQPYADEPIIDQKQDSLIDIAQRAGVSISTAQRWLRRYRLGGLWGLTAPYNPLKRTPQTVSPPRDIGTLDESELQIIYERREMLGELADKRHVSQADVEQRAQAVGRSARTLWTYLAQYRKFGLAGLARKQRDDAGHLLSKHMQDVIVGLRLKYPTRTLNSLHADAVKIATTRGKNIPSLWQVRQICSEIPEALLLYGTGERNQFRNKHQFTYSIRFEGVVYMIDHTLVDVLVRDFRDKKYRNRSGEARLWLTNCIEAKSRYIVAYRFSYDSPNRHHVAAVIRDSILGDPGGIPDEIWVDGGRDLTSNHVRELARDLSIHLKTPKDKEGGKGHSRESKPQIRGRVERPFGTLNTRLWSQQPGYVSSNVQDRPQNVKAVLTPQQLIAVYVQFLETYHNEPHSVLTNENGGEPITPLEYWRENCFAPPIENERLLDILLLEKDFRTVTKKGIQFQNRGYWHMELAPLVGETVMIRADTRFHTPDKVEVYHNGQWVCTAFATDSERGMAVTNEEVANAKKHQRRSLSAQSKRAKKAASAGLRAVKKESKQQASTTSEAPSPEKRKQPKASKPQSKQDTLDHLHQLLNDNSSENN